MDTLIDRGWRSLATALLFAIFGLGSLVATSVVFPGIRLASRSPACRQRRNRRFIGLSFRAFLALMSLLRVCRFDIDEDTRGKLAETRGKLVVGNHPTLIDVLVLLANIDQANCVVKSALWGNPLVLCGIRGANYISNSNVEELMISCESALRAGEALIVFPEATRSVPGESLRLQRGAANVALRARARVQVVHIDCKPIFLSKHMPWYRVPSRKPCFTVRAGVSLAAGDFLRSGDMLPVAARRLTRVLTNELSKGGLA
jgi:1-acyl-sn-glycerol-3-phosphate acyltransferase